MSSTTLIWLNQNSAVIQALSTIVLVLVTIVYAVYTRRMAKIMNRQVVSDIRVSDIILGSQLHEKWFQDRLPFKESSNYYITFKVLFDARNYSSGNGSIDKPTLVLKFPNGSPVSIAPFTKHYEERQITSNMSERDVTDLGQVIFLQGGASARVELGYALEIENGDTELCKAMNDYKDLISFYLFFKNNVDQEFWEKIEDIRPEREVKRK